MSNNNNNNNPEDRSYEDEYAGMGTFVDDEAKESF